MGVPLLTTKLYIPPLRPEWVPRPRLIERLNAGLWQTDPAKGPLFARRLTLLSAPPGFGKTTLLGEWATQNRVAWLSLDEGDNDPPRFLAYLVAAIQTVAAGVGTGVLAALQSAGMVEGPASPAIEALMTALINDIATISAPFVLVLDDYHLVEAPTIHQALLLLLEHMPPQMHLVLSTRADPPWPLGRLRACGALAELRANDLRFEAEEAAAFLTQAMGLNLADGDVARLEARTEGWIAGLQLAALAVRGTLATSGPGRTQEAHAIPRFLQDFAGDDRYVVDYLVEEVLQRQPEPIKSFLLETAILDRLSSSLCDAVTGRSGGQATLEGLERANLFLVPLDGKRQWFRYHQLFADLLRHRLQQALPDQVAVYHRRACDWYEANGFTAEAVDHALAAGDLERAAGLIEVNAWMLLSQGAIGALQGWLDALPEELVHTRPRLDLVCAWTLLAAMQLDAVESHLRGVEGRIQSLSTAGGHTADELLVRGLHGEVAAIRATVANLRGDMPGAIRLAHEALANLPEQAVALRGVVANTLGGAYESQGDMAAASQAFTTAAALSQAAGNPLVALIALGNQCGLQARQGQLYRAAETCHQALQFAAEQGAGPQPAVGMAHVGLGLLSYEWNELDTAAQHLAEAIELGKKAGIAELLVVADLALVKVCQAHGDGLRAAEVVQEAKDLVARYDTSAGLATAVAASQVWLWVVQGDLEAAGRWVQESGLKTEDKESHLRPVEYTALARVLIARGVRLTAALDLLERLRQAAEAQGRMGQVIELLVLQALACQAQGDTRRAMATLSRALSLSEPEGYVRTFVDEAWPGARMGELLRQAATGAAYAGQLLAVLEGERKEAERRKQEEGVHAEGPPGTRPPSPLVEPLGERELLVLRLVAAGLSNREIAQELVITTGTTKWYVNQIYSKLGVHSRTQAIARARELGLL